MKQQKPVAFMSYVHTDDKYKHLTTLRERLSDEVQVQAGREFPIFQDSEGIKLGQNWKQRLETALDEVTFLIPIITPGFFNSKYCRDELQRFLEHERRLNRNDLILPIYYVDCPLLNDEKQRAQDELAQAIASRQYADWRELRFEPFTNPQVGKTLAQLAVQIRDALQLVQAAEQITAPTPALKETQAAGQSPSEKSEQSPQQPSAKTEPPTRIVDPWHRGDHPTISEAIEKADAGDRIVVRPGLYQEALVINKPLEIIGEGEPGEVVVQATGKHVIVFKTTMGRVANLTLQQMGGGKWYGVDIAQGRLELEECGITSRSLAGVAIHDGADPRLRRNRIHDNRQGGGVVIYENGQGTLEDNDIFGNDLSGVEIKTGGNPTLRHNRIHDSKQGSGVVIYENGQGILEDNDIFGNALSGVEIRTGGNPTLQRNRIHNNKENGVYVHKNGQGTLEDNDIFSNTHAGVAVRNGGSPTLRRNRINKNGYEAAWVSDAGGGIIEDNDLRGNKRGAWDIAAESEANVKRSGNVEK
jgi:F-box protein 11